MTATCGCFATIMGSSLSSCDNDDNKIIMVREDHLAMKHYVLHCLLLFCANLFLTHLMIIAK